MGRAIAVIAMASVLGGCGGTALLTGSSTAARTTKVRPSESPATSSGPSQAAYLSALSGEQQKLAAAERALPRRARTPAALSRAILQLKAAIERLATGLGALKPPASVAALHARLTTALHAYAAALGQAARDARRARGEPQAAAVLLAATNSASRSFSVTISAIDRMLTP